MINSFAKGPAKAPPRSPTRPGLLVGWLVICFAVAAIGGFASANAGDFYAALVRPNWAPPAWLFGPVWTLLYAAMAIAAWLVSRAGSIEVVRTPIALFLMQLMLNGLWSWLFFVWQLGALAFIDIALLWCCIVTTLVAFSRHSRIASWLLAPYLLWVTFAAVLNWSVWQANPALLG